MPSADLKTIHRSAIHFAPKCRPLTTGFEASGLTSGYARLSPDSLYRLGALPSVWMVQIS
jgi:hypothetical protein